MRIFNYKDYRTFLSNYIAELPKNGRGEINRIARHAGIHPSLLSQVLSESKNLGLEQAQLVCEYLDLTAPETEHFILMVQYQRAGSVKLQNYFKAKLHASQQASIELGQHVRQDKSLSDEEKSIFYSHWHYMAVWLFTSIKEGKTLDEVSAWFKISREHASEILQFLSKTELCLFENEKYKMGSQSIHLSRTSAHLVRHHTNWRLRAIEACDKISADEMMFTAPLSLSLADFKKIRSRFTEIIKEITDIAIESEAQALACFNLDFFWIK